MRNFRIFIPARLESSRLPGKLLRKINGKELILWTIDAALKAAEPLTDYSRGIVVLTDSYDIRDVVNNYCRRVSYPVRVSCRSEYTRLEHPRNGSERIGRHLAQQTHRTGDLAINWQADEPMLSAGHLSAIVLDYGLVPGCDIMTIATRLKKEEKVVYPIPERRSRFFRRPGLGDREIFAARDFLRGENKLRHIGMYAGSEEFFTWYAKLPQGRLERERRLEQMTVLENGGRINVSVVNSQRIPLAIDTAEDLERFRVACSG